MNKITKNQADKLEQGFRGGMVPPVTSEVAFKRVSSGIYPEHMLVTHRHEELMDSLLQDFARLLEEEE